MHRHPDSLTIKRAVEDERLKVYNIRMEGMVKELLKLGDIHRGEALSLSGYLVYEFV